ncbi:HupE/UreJ family protein [Pseudomonas aeruginosa]|uniref:HupE/UreJ family protein n=10 Tax=Pseudomonas aeruginosa TaxID=287 RepID=UPI0009413CDF|nr:HupE/UreJ family protein [Pseudomonas aeruginosa]AYF68466.1 HupE/UreJ family protein [Pseudomonas aeruginosa]AYQ81401.1 HupE/UreJ family protein [Pseudomonas aeruginosa]AZN46591.1 HupE/UreJ family protein [Pseudomonas aeruginosa]AZN55215.1 HupE/UreJ family protein [Pseudomonas aeruginosa]EKU1211556.1 HupE/UreJ family protein [Pseudomonas aeruginosa]
MNSLPMSGATALIARLRRPLLLPLLAFALLMAVMPEALAHGVPEGDKGFIQESTGVMLMPFIYMGAKHMITGYDHLLFLFGVIFFLYRLKDVGLYVTLFAVGHSITLLFGVLSNISISSYVIDAIIGFSVVYKALDNLGAFQRWFGYQPDTRLATLIFGLLHGFGLATKIQEFEISPDGLIANLIAFNVGVEIGQLLALGGILILMGYWRRTASFWRHAYTANVAMMSAGFLLMGYQITGLIVSQ